jgi:hypothetical protein
MKALTKIIVVAMFFVCLYPIKALVALTLILLVASDRKNTNQKMATTTT